MVLSIFEGVRDVTLTRKEVKVTENKTGEVIKLPAVNECNVLIETKGLEGDASLSIKVEESKDGESNFTEIATFPVPDARHGILFAKRKDYVRYSLIVSGSEPELDVTIKF